MGTFDKVCRIGWSKEIGSTYVHIKFDGKRLSITGAEGPLRSGTCRGSCGQIVIHTFVIDKYSRGWDEWKTAAFRYVWKRWHLNDMRSICEHQRELGWTWKTHGAAKCPECGYSLGSAWLFEPVPEHILDFLKNLPDSDTTPAWV